MDMDVKQLLAADIVIFDGAMGTMLQSQGLKAGELPEVFNITHPDLITKIHQSYIASGAQVITTNTFGANALKLDNSGYTVEEIIAAAIANAKQATVKAATKERALIALNVGPLSELLEPMGTLKFEMAYQLFQQQVIQGVASGADLVIIETMTDLYEAKAAILAVKENSNLPVFCTMSFDNNGRTFTGCSVDAMVLVLQGLGVEALGVNCSLGPQELAPIVERIMEIASIPVIVQANAGIPQVINGVTSFNCGPEDFGTFGRKFATQGVKILGGCCGTTNQHIRALVRQTQNVTVTQKPVTSVSGVCTPTKTVLVDDVTVIGERINPTGKKAFKQALKKQDMDYILKEGIRQVQAGAEILDVNVGLPEIDEARTMEQVVKALQTILDVPLQIDSNDPEVIERGLRAYNGKAIVNSVNGDDRVLDQVLPIVKKYGAAVVGLTLDADGIPETAIGRYEIAEKIVRRAQKYGIVPADVYIDCLTLTAAANQEQVQTTLEAIKLVKERLGVKTVLGVSNVSFGLPKRELLNRTFLAAALTAGLDLPIINPLDTEMMETVAAYRVLSGTDVDSREYVKLFSAEKAKMSDRVLSKPDSLELIILQGMKDKAQSVTRQLLSDVAPLTIIDQHIVPALDLVGKSYEQGKLFLPQLIQAAETVKESLHVIKAAIGTQAEQEMSQGHIIMATVQGDIHDIGKNIVKVLLESYGFEVTDLGRDVAIETVVAAAIEHEVRLVGLSALMTTTVKNMELTIKALKQALPKCQVMVGGAVLNQEYADMIGADYYSKDANGAVAIAQQVFKHE